MNNFGFCYEETDWCPNGIYRDDNGDVYGLNDNGEIDWDDKCISLAEWLGDDKLAEQIIRKIYEKK